jgi:hypothetical protein
MRTQTGYTKDIEMKMKRLFATLSEKDRRRYGLGRNQHGGRNDIGAK